MLPRILVPLDGTPVAERALPYAMELAQAAGGSVILLSPSDTYVEQQLSRLQAERVAVEALTTRGDTHASVIAEIRSKHPGLVVVTRRCRRPGIRGILLHQLADSLIEEHVAPVLQVRAAIEGGADQPALLGAQVLVALDGSELAEAALPIAVELARALKGEIVLLEVVAESFMLYAVPTELMTTDNLDVELAWSPSYAVREDEAYLKELADRLAGEADGVHLTTQVRGGDLTEQIRVISKSSLFEHPSAPRAALIVMATHGRHGLSRWFLGSTTADVVGEVNAPVLAVPVRPVSESSATQRVAAAASNRISARSRTDSPPKLPPPLRRQRDGTRSG